MNIQQGWKEKEFREKAGEHEIKRSLLWPPTRIAALNCNIGKEHLTKNAPAVAPSDIFDISKFYL